MRRLFLAFQVAAAGLACEVLALSALVSGKVF
jgi:hypothetical protein